MLTLAYLNVSGEWDTGVAYEPEILHATPTCATGGDTAQHPAPYIAA